MEEKLVSIIVPSYNHEKYILDCLESIKSQTYKNIELLIADDCSTDGTFEKAKTWVEENKDRFVRAEVYKNQNNLGVVKNNNSLLKKCRGAYIKDLASDDFLEVNCIEKMVEFAEENADYDIVFSNGYSVRGSAGFPIDERDIIREFYKKPVNTEGDFFGRLYMYNRIVAPSVLFRYSTFQKFGYYSEELAFEDWEYWLRVARTGKIGFINMHTVFYRELENSISHFGNDKAGRERLRRYYKEEERLLSMYSKYTNCTTDYFWCSVLLRAWQSKDYELISSLIKERKVTMLKVIKGVVQKIKNQFAKYV